MRIRAAAWAPCYSNIWPPLPAPTALSEFEAYVLGENNRMLDVFDSSGFRVQRALESGVFHVAFPTQETAQVRAAEDQRERLAAAQSVRAFFHPAVRRCGRRLAHALARLAMALLTNLQAPWLSRRPLPRQPACSRDRRPASLSDGQRHWRPGGSRPHCRPRHSRRRGRGGLCPCRGARRGGHFLRFCRSLRGRTAERAAFAPPGACGGHAHGGAKLYGPAQHRPGRLAQRHLYAGVATAGQHWHAVAERRPRPGRARLCRSTLNVGISTFVSVGNKADVSSNDLLAYWADDPCTDVIVLYLESFGNPRKFARLAPEVARRKPIVAVKSGRSAAGARAASSHSAALANLDVAVDALFTQAGVIRTNTLEELFDVAALLSTQPLPPGPALAWSPMPAALAFCWPMPAKRTALTLPELTPETTAALRDLPAGAGGTGQPGRYDCLRHPGTLCPHHASWSAPTRNIDAVVAIYIPPLVTNPDDIAQAIAQGAGTVPATNRC